MKFTFQTIRSGKATGSDPGSLAHTKQKRYCTKALPFLLLFLLCFPAAAPAQANDSIITATGEDVPKDTHLPEEYRFPETYQENAVQFTAEDGVLLCGYVLGTGKKGVTLGHARGWQVKSWLPFAERLVEEGYQVILWSFRDTPPSGSAKNGTNQRWDLDVLAAAQVLRERGVTEIISMGASYGGTATAAAAPKIPELVGIGILSSPAFDMEIDPINAMHSVTVPAFFAVSVNDWQNAPGVYQTHVEALYEACASEQKTLHIIEGSDHGTDLITIPVDSEPGYAAIPATEEQKQRRRELAEQLMQFIRGVFTDEPPHEPVEQPPENKPAVRPAEIVSTDTDSDEPPARRTEPSNFYAAGAIIFCIILLFTIVVLYKISSGNKKK